MYPNEVPQQHVADAAVLLLDTRVGGRRMSRQALADAGVPDKEQARKVASALSAAVGRAVNPRSLQLAVALLRSKLTIDEIRAAAVRPEVGAR